MTDDGFKGPQADADQDDFERNAVDPVPWIGQDPVETPGVEHTVPGVKDESAGPGPSEPAPSHPGSGQDTGQ